MPKQLARWFYSYRGCPVKQILQGVTEEDLINLLPYHIYLKLMVDGVVSRGFSGRTVGPIDEARVSWK